MTTTATVLAAVTGPLLGLVVVIVAYCLGIFLSIKCCRPDSETQSASSMLPHSAILQGSPGLDIFIMPRSEEYLVNIPRATTMNRHYLGSNNQENPVVGLPSYEEPPSYEECVQNGFA